MLSRVRQIVAFLVLAGAASARLALAASIPELRVTYLDSESRQPVAGANVIFYLQAYSGTLTGHGGKTRNIFIAEAVTDATGAVVFAPQNFFVVPFSYSYLVGPKLLMYKSGYEMGKSPNAVMFAGVADAIAWAGNGIHRYEVKKASNVTERARAFALAKIEAEALYGYGSTERCDWEKIPLFIQALESGRAEVLRLMPDSRSGAGAIAGYLDLGSPMRALDQLASDACKKPKEVFSAGVPRD